MDSFETKLWLPRRMLRHGTVIAREIQQVVVAALSQPNDGPEDERFEKDLRQLLQLFESGEDFYVCGARVRQLLDPAAPIRWSPDQVAEIKRLGGLLHPKYLVSNARELPPTARLVQSLIFAERPHPVLSPLERAVLWRLSHLYPVLAFCELIVALGYPNQDSAPGSAPSPQGAAVAAKSALELTAHFVSGGKSGGCDPFDDAMSFGYTNCLGRLGENDDKWRDAPKWYKILCDALRNDQPEYSEVLGVCHKIVNLVCELPDFKREISRALGQLVTHDLNAGLHLVPPKTKGFVVLSFRTDFHECRWPTSPETIGRSMSWTGYDSPRLQALGYSTVRAYDSPALVDVSDLMVKMDLLATSNAKAKGLLHDVKSLIHAFCVSSNLGNILALGAIARQLHLQVEKLTVAVDRGDPYVDRRKGESDTSWKERKPREDDKSLKCIEEQLKDISTKSTDLNLTRRALQDILESYAHPGWLIRTELLRVREKASGSSHQVLFITGAYSPPYISSVESVDGRTTKIQLIPINPCAKSHFEELSRAFPAVLRTALTGGPNGKITPGSAIDIPFVAFDFCRRALEAVVQRME